METLWGVFFHVKVLDFYIFIIYDFFSFKIIIVKTGLIGCCIKVLYLLTKKDQIPICKRKGLFRYKVFLYRAYILEQSSLDEMKGI